jgi:squalene-hopene/tetraprenyl-beta-curcumene cyclase
LLCAQNADGGWGGAPGTPSTTEQTALAIEALAEIRRFALEVTEDAINVAIARGITWLIAHTNRGTRFDPSPIGFYFAKLWYFEQLYPLIFAIGALNATKVLVASDQAKAVKTRNLEDEVKPFLPISSRLRAFVVNCFFRGPVAVVRALLPPW